MWAFVILLTSGWAMGAAPASAQEVHPRVARALGVTEELPAVWLSDTEVWVASRGAAVVSVCAHAGSRCRRVIAEETCEAPECPGAGTRLGTAEPLGSIDDFPEDVDDFTEEIQGLREEPRLSELAGSFQSHPDFDPDPDEDAGTGFGLTLSLGGVVAGGTNEGWFSGAAGGLGLVYSFDTEDAFDDDDGASLFATLVGDRIGIESRVRVFRDPSDTNDSAPAITIGGAIVFQNRVADSIYQLPSMLGLFLPELGVMFRGDRSSFYLGFGIPVKLFVSDSVAVEVRATALIVSDLNDGTAGNLLSLSLQGDLL